MLGRLTYRCCVKLAWWPHRCCCCCKTLAGEQYLLLPLLLDLGLAILEVRLGKIQDSVLCGAPTDSFNTQCHSIAWWRLCARFGVFACTQLVITN